MTDKKLILYIFIGGAVGVIYITTFGNYPILPDVYNWINLTFSDGEIISWILFPVPFFPIIFGIGGYLYIQATKEDEK
tara:strand:- start:322 stop:555 length:234 start_codon:yes stop_codon:yes gene_type:complete